MYVSVPILNPPNTCCLYTEFLYQGLLSSLQIVNCLMLIKSPVNVFPASNLILKLERPDLIYGVISHTAVSNLLFVAGSLSSLRHIISINASSVESNSWIVITSLLLFVASNLIIVFTSIRAEVCLLLFTPSV